MLNHAYVFTIFFVLDLTEHSFSFTMNFFIFLWYKTMHAYFVFVTRET